MLGSGVSRERALFSPFFLPYPLPPTPKSLFVGYIALLRQGSGKCYRCKRSPPSICRHVFITGSRKYKLQRNPQQHKLQTHERYNSGSRGRPRQRGLIVSGRYLRSAHSKEFKACCVFSLLIWLLLVCFWVRGTVNLLQNLYSGVVRSC